jgi:hypothetical protein
MAGTAKTSNLVCEPLQNGRYMAGTAKRSNSICESLKKPDRFMWIHRLK